MMCTICGCEGHEADAHLVGVVHAHDHEGPDHGQAAPGALATLAGTVHAHGLPPERALRVELDILSRNAGFAAANRQRLRASHNFTLNCMSSPGAGKTTLLVRTIRDLAGGGLTIGVIEGDQQTALDAERIHAAGARAVQVNTGRGCHLDAHMVGHAIDHLALPAGALLFIENVGNLVCPSAFDLGEDCKVVMLSVTEGEDKPLKYPDMFACADLLLITKTDLLPHVDFDGGRCLEHARRVRPGIEVLSVSAKDGTGLNDWYAWLQRRLAVARVPTAAAAAQ